MSRPNRSRRNRQSKFLSKAKCIAYMIIGILLCVPMIISIFFPSMGNHAITVLLLMVGAPMFFIGFSDHQGNRGKSVAQQSQDLSRIRFAEETKLRGGK